MKSKYVYISDKIQTTLLCPMGRKMGKGHSWVLKIRKRTLLFFAQKKGHFCRLKDTPVPHFTWVEQFETTKQKRTLLSQFVSLPNFFPSLCWEQLLELYVPTFSSWWISCINWPPSRIQGRFFLSHVISAAAVGRVCVVNWIEFTEREHVYLCTFVTISNYLEDDWYFDETKYRQKCHLRLTNVTFFNWFMLGTGRES